MLRDRTVRTLLLSGLAILLGGLMRPFPAPSQAAARERFLARKALWSSDYDLVFAGDSRTYVDVAPAVIRKRLPGFHVANFGFDGGGFSAAYLASVERLLNPRSSRKTIVLGVTARAMTPLAVQENSFTDLARKSRPEVYAMFYLARVRRIFRPYDLWQIAAAARGAPASTPSDPELGYLSQTYSKDGWCGIKRVAGGPQAQQRATQKTLEQYAEIFSQSPVSNTIAAGLLDRVRGWHSRGIRVYGFRPPTPAAMADLENTTGRFDEAAFVRRFERAGGQWLRFRPEQYACYDASHLTEASALKFSADLGTRLRLEVVSAGHPLLPR